MTTRYSKRGHQADYFLITLIFLLAIAGLAILASASSDLGRIKFNDSYYYLKHQILYGLSIGLVGFFVASKVHYQHYKKFALPLLLLSLIVLSLVFTHLGIQSRGANRWLRLGPISIQPGEFLKITYLIYIAAWLSNTKMARSKNITEGLLPFLMISGFVALLLVMQPATSTVAILLSAGLTVYFISGAKIKYIVGTVLIGACALALLVLITPYRFARINAFLHSSSDMEGASYHINEARIAIGSGQLWGVGLGQSTTKVKYLPGPIDDSIFAVVAEELGFVGAGTLVVLFVMLTFRMFLLAKEVRDNFGRFLLVGFGCVIAFQSIVHIGAISGIFPLTGVPLPFISYGGTALAVFLTMGGISVNISRYI